MIDIAIVDYGMGNLRSVSNALERVARGQKVLVTGVADDVRDARRVVFPGQGAMPDCMRELDARGLRPAVLEAARSRPFLGICIGLQMLFDASEEGDVPGLGLLPGRVVRFPATGLIGAGSGKLKVPHMGWNEVQQAVEHPLWRGIQQASRFYFVHSYYPVPRDRSSIAAYASYPSPFACAVARDNLFAVQFHPEKSQELGLKLLSNFVVWDGIPAAPKHAIEEPLAGD